MTKEEAHKVYYPITGVNLSGKKDLIDKIYDDFEKIYDDFESRVCENCEYCEEVARGSSIYRCNKSVVSSPTGCNDLNGYSIRLLSCNKFKRKSKVKA